MQRTPIHVLLFAEEPGQAAYLETILGMEAPGVFKACLWEKSSATACAGEPDLFLVVLDPAAGGDADALLGLVDPARTPTIVVSPWLPGLPETLELVRKGVEDVLGLADLSPRRLVAAILKVVERKARAEAWPAPLQGLLAPPGAAGLLEGLPPSPQGLCIPQEA